MVQSDSMVTPAHERAILQQTPNGVIMVDRETRVHYVNPAFRTMFACPDEVLLDKPVAGFLHSDCFERAIATGGNLKVKESIPEHELSYRAELFPIVGRDMYCGIFVDITGEEEAKSHYRDLKAHTLNRAQEVISRQMQTAQEIARLLGETTAETKILLVKLMSLFEEEKM
ncbi:MAG: PAS domain-containing protein [Kiritimatiellae bacterium]|nr:PAS domain-containing protein [Kiritimatiellia bacterium]